MNNDDLQFQRMTTLEDERSRRDAYLDRHEQQREADREWLSELYQWAVPIDPESYDAWLTGHLKRGGKVAHFYDYVMPRDQWYLATLSFEIQPLYGATSINLVVPKGIKIDGSTGHNNLYFMDGFTSRGLHDLPAIVPCFTDTKIVEENR